MEYTGISMIDYCPDRISEKLILGLPGVSGQQKMAPSVRFSGDRLPDPGLSRQSSVLILLFPQNGSWGTVLIERTLFGPHAGQISFPGGKQDHDDQSELLTALREANEEVGVKQDSIKILGQLSKLFVPNSNFWISPFIAWVDFVPDWQPNPSEVKSIITVTLSDLFDDSNKKRKTLSRNGVHIDAPYYDIHGHMVWGATAMIISEFETLLKRNTPIS